MSEAQKDTIYIDVDDEITGIIDKVRNSEHKIVALVLPKRATVLQSIVNMKLLKRSAQKAKKNLVLITSEAGLLPLAGAVGLHVAKNLQSKPAIPKPPEKDDAAELLHEEELEGDEDSDPDLDNSKSVGELAGVPAAAAAGAALAAEETIDLDDEDKSTGKNSDKPKGKKNKKLKVPNFDRFRTVLLISGVVLLALIIGGYFAVVKMPKAKIVIKTDSTDSSMTVNFTANTSSKVYDEAGKVVPAEVVTVKKSETQTAPATGQKDNGTKASGSITITAQKCSGNPFVPPSDIPAGTGVSSGGQTYITQETASFHGTGTSGSCYTYAANGNTNITAQAAGDKYNVNNANFTIAGRSDASATGSASGGTSQIVKIVSQSDADAAKAKMNQTAQDNTAKTEMVNNLKKDGFFPIDSSVHTEGPNYTTTPGVGEPGDNVTVVSNTTYTMLGVNKDDLNKLISAQAKGQIDTSKQAVQSTNLDTAEFVVTGKDNPQVTVTTSVTIGPNLDTNAIKRDIAGKKKAETKEIILSRPSIKDVTISYSPFWVNKTPKDAKKVTITFEKAK